jgi:uncharacterized protein YacL
MILVLLRVIFLALVSAVASTYLWKVTASATTATQPLSDTAWTFQYLVMFGSIVVSLGIITFDILSRRKKLSSLSGLFFGLLVGIVLAVVLGYLLDRIVAVLGISSNYESLIQGTKLLLSLMSCYVVISFIFQTKDDFRFIIPYVEFSRATKGPRPLILDTSVIIDGRVADLATTGIFESRLLVPRFVLDELQLIADSSDKLKRSRGKRGLDMLQRLKSTPKIDLHIWDGSLAGVPDNEAVDAKLVALGQQENARIMTNDFNLNKIAQLRGVDVININTIAETLKPVALPGETMRVRVMKHGEGAGQGVGYLEDGTMVVVEAGRDRVGQDIDITVTNVLQTAAGKMIFGRADGNANPQRRVRTEEPAA